MGRPSPRCPISWDCSPLSTAFLCPLLMDPPLFFFSGSLALGRGAVQTSEPVVKVAENKRELGGAVEGGGSWREGR